MISNHQVYQNHIKKFEYFVLKSLLISSILLDTMINMIILITFDPFDNLKEI